MLVYWRFTIAFFSIAITFIAFYYLVKISIYDIKFADNLPSKGIKDIPPSDVILPNIFAQIPLSPPTEKTAQNTRPALSNTDFNFTCNNNKGPVCTCGASQISSASSILSNAFFPIFISLVISVYYYI
ncbi:hypothetical protein RIR_jg1985.t1 [Rhizophagus irregularis DAOM 181602=DAOM 197198]|nr:hypothetical protein RIR_jg1985.t1 [Rhizophagus irregularis DAOM 181602=DAOM 197198]